MTDTTKGFIHPSSIYENINCIFCQRINCHIRQTIHMLTATAWHQLQHSQIYIYIYIMNS